MTEEFDWSQPPFVRKVFRWPFWKTLGVVALLTLPLAVLLPFILGDANLQSWSYSDWDQVLIYGLLYPLIFSCINYYYWSIVLTPETIGATGGMRTIRFEDIEKVSRPWHGLGLSIVVKKKGAWLGLHIPTFMHDMDDFIRSVDQVVPIDNPLRQYFHRLER